MKDIKKNITVISIVFVMLFTLLTGYFLYDVFIYSGRWISSAYNPRLREKRATVIPGSIYDVNGVELAGSAYGNRTYINDGDIRLSVCHALGDIYGFSPLGVETTQGAWLLGFNESLLDRVQRVLLNETAHGSDITLTINANINSKIYSLMKDLRGGIVVLNYKTGEILAMVSLPNFDLTEIDVNVEHGGADEKSLVNRVLQGKYSPGNLFVPVTAAAAMEYLDLSGFSFDCKGSYHTEDGTIEDILIHGRQTFEQAVANNCESILAELAVETGSRRLLKTAFRLGFNYQFLFSDIVVYQSEINLNSLNTDYDIALAGIGRDRVKVTPMHMAMMYGAIPNGGKISPLKLIVDIEGVDMSKRNDSLRKSFEYAVADKLDEILKTENPIEASEIQICGRSAKVYNNTDDYDTISWYAGYSDNEKYPYAISIAIEDYGEGTEELRQLVAEIFEEIIDNGE